MAGANWTGLWTLYCREVRRFLKVAAQTVTGPVVAVLLILAVFAVASGSGRQATVADPLPYLAFLVPGLIVMAMAQNAFANTSSSLLIAKVQGSIADYLMAPLSPAELVAGFALGGVTRGLLVGVAVGAAVWPFVPFGVAHVEFALFHAVAGSLLLSLLGILGGLWAVKMDHLAAVTNFLVIPLTFLSGTFYSIAELPAPLRVAAGLNPFFHVIDGFRYGLTGHADGSPAIGLAAVCVADVLLALACHRLVAAGWRLRP
jgi:ABC-2 type transport system permease protein